MILKERWDDKSSICFYFSNFLFFVFFFAYQMEHIVTHWFKEDTAYDHCRNFIDNCRFYADL